MLLLPPPTAKGAQGTDEVTPSCQNPEPRTQEAGLLLRPHAGVQSVGCAMMHFLNHQEQVDQLGDVVPKPTQLTLRVTMIKTQAPSYSFFFSSECLPGIPPERGD